MGLALAKIKKLPKRRFTLGSYVSMALFFSPMTPSPEFRNQICKFSTILGQGSLIIYQKNLFMSRKFLLKDYGFGFLAILCNPKLIEISTNMIRISQYYRFFNSACRVTAVIWS